MKTFIILPTYNERDNITKLVPEIYNVVPDINILVVDDNSPDKTAEAVEEMQKRYPSLRLLKRAGKEGLGKAYIHAFKKLISDGEADSLITMDADFSHHPEYLPKMIAGLDNADVVIGSRYIKGGGTAGWELWRVVLSSFANFYCRVITGLPVHDCTSGFNAMKIDMLKQVDLDDLGPSGYAFLMALKYALNRKGAKFTEIPIIFTNRREGESKISNHIIREGVIAPWKMILKK